MKLIYIAGPYAADSNWECVENSLRAMAVSRLAVRKGNAPIALHSSILMGGLGDDNLPVEREQGLLVACDMVRLVAGSSGEFWGICSEAGEVSTGVAAELEAWVSSGGGPVIMRSWEEWKAVGADVPKTETALWEMRDGC